jgi:Cys-tRNA(Pro) deacylase
VHGAPEWPEPVERVAAFLRETGAEARIEEFADETPTAADAAEAVGCSLEQIVKSLVLICDGRPVVALVPGDRRGDPKKIARASGSSKARIATAEEVEGVTGFAPGSVAPFPLPKVRTIYLDRSLLRHPRVWCGSGSEKHLVSLAPAELARLTRAQSMDVVQGDPYHFVGDTGGDPPDPKEG